MTAEFENYVYISLLGKYQRLFSWIIYYIYILYRIDFTCQFQHVSMNYCKARTHLQAAYARQEVVFGVHDAVVVTDATGKGVAGQNRKLVMNQPSVSLAPDLARAGWIGKGKGEEK